MRKKYHEAGKKIVVRAFGNAESPTSGKKDPVVCAKGLASFILKNNLDGVDIHYRDNTAFNNGIAQNWLIIFTNALRDLLPFHLISHTIQDYLLKDRYPNGNYAKVI